MSAPKKPWNKGLTKETDERLLNLSKKVKNYYKIHTHTKGMKGKHHTKESKQQMSDAKQGKLPWNTGKHRSEATKQKIRDYYKTHTHPSKGKPAWNSGLTKETDSRVNNLSKAKKGIPCPENKKIQISNTLTDWDFYWEHGIKRSNFPYADSFNSELKKKIAERDYYQCQLCNELLPDKKAIHHIDYDKLNSNPENLIFLCNYCHTKTNYNRQFWQSYFEQHQSKRFEGGEL